MIKKLFIFLAIGIGICTNALAEGQLVFDVHIVVLTTNPAAIERASPEQLQREVDILNTYFVGKNGERPVGFRFKSAYYARDVGNTTCQNLLSQGGVPQEYDRDSFKSFYDACKDFRVVDPRAINIYIYDAYSDADGFATMTSRGYNNGNRPFIIIDWERLNHNIQSPEEHEMGHAFGLKHVCAFGANSRTSTNIMASKECGKGSGGLRNIGFDAHQLVLIRWQAQQISHRFAFPERIRRD